eukprot:829612-Pleurochrysis_carterae.AAC.2
MVRPPTHLSAIGVQARVCAPIGLVRMNLCMRVCASACVRARVQADVSAGCEAALNPFQRGEAAKRRQQHVSVIDCGSSHLGSHVNTD